MKIPEVKESCVRNPPRQRKHADGKLPAARKKPVHETIYASDVENDERIRSLNIYSKILRGQKMKD